MNCSYFLCRLSTIHLIAEVSTQSCLLTAKLNNSNICDHILENLSFGHSWTFVINCNKSVLVKNGNLAKKSCNSFLAQ